MWQTGKSLNFSADGEHILALNQAAVGNQIQSVANGTVTRPAYSWVGSTNTGFYYDETDTYIGVTLSGVFNHLIGATGMTGMVDRGASIGWGPGSATSGPAYGFFSDPNTGMFSPATDIIEFATGGDIALRLDASAVTSGYTPSIITNDTGMAVGHNSASRTLTLTTGSTTRVTIAGNGDFVEIDSALVYEPGATTNLTSDNQAVTIGAKSYLKISSNDATPANRTFTLSNGVRTGQILIIQCVAGAAQLQDLGNVEINAVMDFGVEDTLSLIWDGGDWVETGRSNN
jgi:hypothetical protein